MLKHLRAIPVLLLLAGLVVGCGSIPAVASLVPAAGPLVTVTTRGGECPDGTCGSTTIIERDGRFHMTEPEVAAFGTIATAALTALDAAVKTTDFAAIRALPFRGECPVNFDGQETIYEFATPSGIERLESCQTEIDPNHPLFAALATALQTVTAEPT